MTGGWVAVAAALLRRRVTAVAVTGPSMSPTLNHGDVIVVRRTPGRTPDRGDLVVVSSSGPCRPDGTPLTDHPAWLVKRVAAIPGDPAPGFLPAWTRDHTGRVPAGHVVLLGDNPDASRDSRHYGPVRTERVLGVVLHRLPRRRARSARWGTARCR